MGLGRIILKTTAKTVVKTATDVATYKVLESEAAHKVKENLTYSFGHASGMKTEEECLYQTPSLYKLIIKKAAKKVDVLLDEVELWDAYYVYDQSGEKKYTIRGTLIMGKHHFHIYDEDDRELGVFKKDLVNIPFPFVEKNPKGSKVQIGENQTFTIRTYLDVFDKIRKFEVADIDYEIKTCESKYEYEITYGDRKKQSTVAYIQKTIVFDSDVSDNYVLSYNDSFNEIIYVMMVLGIDSMIFAEEK